MMRHRIVPPTGMGSIDTPVCAFIPTLLSGVDDAAQDCTTYRIEISIFEVTPP